MTARRTELLNLIRCEIEAGRPFPTRAALARAMGWRNESSVADAIWALVKDGRLQATQCGRHFAFAITPQKSTPRPAAPGTKKKEKTDDGPESQG